MPFVYLPVPEEMPEKRIDARFSGRQEWDRRPLPGLHQPWMHLLPISPVHPLEMKRLFAERGEEAFPEAWLEIDAREIRRKHAAAYCWLNASPRDPKNFTPFGIEKLAKLASFETQGRSLKECEEARVPPDRNIRLGLPLVLYSARLYLRRTSIIMV